MDHVFEAGLVVVAEHHEAVTSHVGDELAAVRSSRTSI
jgi:hypothetical protein